MVSVFAETPAEGRVFHCADAFATLVIVNMQVRVDLCFDCTAVTILAVGVFE